jgi:hypothetical protein
MRASTEQALSILEQARFVVDLLTIHELSLADVAETLSRSKGWVSMRRRLLEGMSDAIRQILFRGDCVLVPVPAGRHVGHANARWASRRRAAPVVKTCDSRGD